MEKLNSIVKMITKLFALKGKQPTQHVIEVWAEVLQKFEVPDIAKACNVALQKDGWFEIKMLLDELTPNNKAIAENKWEKVLKIAKNGGQGYDKLCENTRKTLEASGGIRKIQYSDSQYAIDTMKKYFVNTYSQKGIANDGGNYFFIESDDKKRLTNE